MKKAITYSAPTVAAEAIHTENGIAISGDVEGMEFETKPEE